MTDKETNTGTADGAAGNDQATDAATENQITDDQAADAQAEAEAQDAGKTSDTVSAAGLTGKTEGDPSATYSQGVPTPVNTAIPADAEIVEMDQALNKGYLGYAPGPTEVYTFAEQAAKLQKQGADAGAVVNASAETTKGKKSTKK